MNLYHNTTMKVSVDGNIFIIFCFALPIKKLTENHLNSPDSGQLSILVTPLTIAKIRHPYSCFCALACIIFSHAYNTLPVF